MIIDNHTTIKTSSSKKEEEVLPTTHIHQYEFPDEIKVITDNITDLKVISTNIVSLLNSYYKFEKQFNEIDWAALTSPYIKNLTIENIQLLEELSNFQTHIINVSSSLNQIKCIHNVLDKLLNLEGISKELTTISVNLDKLINISNNTQSINILDLYIKNIQNIHTNISNINNLSQNLSFIIHLDKYIKSLESIKASLKISTEDLFQMLQIFVNNIQFLQIICNNMSVILELGQYLHDNPNILFDVNKKVSELERKQTNLNQFLDTKLKDNERRITSLIQNFILRFKEKRNE